MHLLCSIVVTQKWILQQGDSKNAFYHAVSPNTENVLFVILSVTPATSKTHTGSSTEPCMVCGGVLTIGTICLLLPSKTTDMVLQQSVYAPCLFSGQITSDIAASTNSENKPPLHQASPKSSLVYMLMTLSFSLLILQEKNTLCQNSRKE